MKCPKCGGKMYREDGEWHCEKCWGTFWRNFITGELVEDEDPTPYGGPDKEEPDEIEWSDLS